LNSIIIILYFIIDQFILSKIVSKGYIWVLRNAEGMHEYKGCCHATIGLRTNMFLNYTYWNICYSIPYLLSSLIFTNRSLLWLLQCRSNCSQWCFSWTNKVYWNWLSLYSPTSSTVNSIRTLDIPTCYLFTKPYSPGRYCALVSKVKLFIIPPTRVSRVGGWLSH
jgi:hypothetical protein